MPQKGAFFTSIAEIEEKEVLAIAPKIASDIEYLNFIIYFPPEAKRGFQQIVYCDAICFLDGSPVGTD